MKNLFPEMTESIEKGYIFCIFAYWLVCFVVFPFLIPVLAYGLWENTGVMVWFDCVYYAVNGCVMLMILGSFLRDSWFTVQLNPKNIIGTTAIASGLMILWVLISMFILTLRFEQPLFVWNIFPISQMGVAMTPGLLVEGNPVFGTLCLTVLVPVTVCGLFYVTVFGPVCCNHGGYAYTAVTLLLILPSAFDIFWRGDLEFEILTYLFRLPVHLLACWSYQKTDTVWAPIFSLGTCNLLTSLASIMIIG